MKQRWSNWSGYQSCTPEAIHSPTDLTAIQSVIKNAAAQGKTIRAVGSGHSFSGLIPSDQWLLSLQNYQGVISVDKPNCRAWIKAGSNLKNLGPELFSHGLAQENLGDIDEQALAGAMSTGTHGTGVEFGSLSTQISGIKILDATGTEHTLSLENDPDTFKAAQVSLGSMGIITEYELKLRPAYKLHFRAGKESLQDVLNNYTKYNITHRNFEFYWFPYSDRVQTKFSNTTNQAAKKPGTLNYLSDLVLENYAFKVLSEIARIAPSTAASISKLSASAVSTSEKTNWSHNVYALPRLVLFNEMEYNVPRAAFADVIMEMRACMEKEKFKVHFPIECRFVKQDDIFLSPAYKRESAYIAIHMYKGMPWKEYFQAMEEIFIKFEGRPHWGKMHHRTAADLAPAYPKWDTFLEQRGKMDPNGMFLNPHLSTLFGIQ